LGLTSIAVSIHEQTSEKQAKAYRLDKYPPFVDVFDNIRKYGLGGRATLLLCKGSIDSAKTYEEAVDHLTSFGVNNISSWPIGNPDGTRNEYTISRRGLWGIRWWLHRNARLCHSHSWGGGVFDYNGNILRLTSYVTKHNRRKNFVRQLVVFTDGTVAYSWIKEGALCLK